MHNSNKKTTPPDFLSFSTDGTSQSDTAEEKDKATKRIKRLPVITSALFVIGAFYCLIHHADTLFMAQDRSLFIADTSFWNDKMTFIGGFSQWAGCFLTQFFYYPWAGASLLIVLWTLLAWMLTKTYRLNGMQATLALVIPAALLLSEIDLGYWIYFFKQPGYWFSQTLSVMLMTGEIWASSRLRGWWKIGSVVVLTTLCYPLIGFWALAAAFWAGAEAALSPADGRTRIGTGLASVASIIAVPMACYMAGYVRQRFEDLWTVNFPLFGDNTVSTLVPTVPFIVIACWPAVLLAAQRWNEKQEHKTLTGKRLALAMTGSIALSLALPAAVYALAYDNYNYKAEIRIYRAIDENDFDRVLDEVSKVPGPMTRQMVISKNIALMNKGIIGDCMFKYDNSGEPPYTYDSLHVHMVHTAGPQIYYQYGKANFACRWAIENGVEYGFNFNDLKMLTRCAMISGEKEVAMKYIQILSNTLFQKAWAQERLNELQHPALYQQSAEYKNIMPLRCFRNTLDGDEGLVEMYLINYFSHMNLKQPKFQETALVYSLIQKDISLFWPKFFGYANLHETEPMPIHYQEAAYLYGNLEKNIDIQKMPFDQQRIVKRYAEFQNMSQSMLAQGMTAEQVGEACKPVFGDTFWWFYFFCRNVKSY